MSEATKTRFRIQIGDPKDLREIESNAPVDLKNHFELIKKGLETIPGVPGEAIYGAVTLRGLSLKPKIFESWFLTKYHSVKQGEIDKGTKELLASVISKINEEEECVACAPYHSAAAKFEGASDSDISIIENYENEKQRLSEIKRDIIDFGIKSAFHPKKITSEDVEKVKRHGISDPGLVEIVSSALIAYNLSAFNQIFHLQEGAE